MIQEAVKAPAKLGGFSVHLLQPGVSLSKLEIGTPDPAAGRFSSCRPAPHDVIRRRDTADFPFSLRSDIKHFGG
ncbi:MAG: hypothetical protein ACYTFY_09370 [Planctomycetota bacterium]